MDCFLGASLAPGDALRVAGGATVLRSGGLRGAAARGRGVGRLRGRQNSNRLDERRRAEACAATRMISVLVALPGRLGAVHWKKTSVSTVLAVETRKGKPGQNADTGALVIVRTAQQNHSSVLHNYGCSTRSLHPAAARASLPTTHASQPARRRTQSFS